MNLENIMLSERNQTRKTTHLHDSIYMKQQMARISKSIDRKYSNDCLKPREESEGGDDC